MATQSSSGSNALEDYERKMTELIRSVSTPLISLAVIYEACNTHTVHSCNLLYTFLLHIQPLYNYANYYHSAFESHPQAQPPTPHPTPFFLLDFIKNSYNSLQQIDKQKFASGDRGAKEAFNEIVGRNSFATILVNDTSGKLSMMTGGDPRNPIDFGPEIKAKAEALKP